MDKARTDAAPAKPTTKEAAPAVAKVMTVQAQVSAGGLQTATQAAGVVVNIAEAKRGSSEVTSHLTGMMGDAPFCDQCGHVTVRNGACYKCLNCGNSMGCS